MLDILVAGLFVYLLLNSLIIWKKVLCAECVDFFTEVFALKVHHGMICSFYYIKMGMRDILWY